MELLSYLIPLLLLITSSATYKETETENYRLPKNVIPTHYTVELVIDPEDANYSGFVEITVTTTNVTDDTILLHASLNYLTIKDYVLLDYFLGCTISDTDNSTEIITLSCPKGSLSDGKHRVILEFDAVLSNDEVGVFKSRYNDADEEQIFVATKFKPVYARRAFPCFDEPSFKATFDLYVTHPDSYIVLSNTPQIESNNVGIGQLQTKFATTPKMSTYLVTFFVSKLVEAAKVETEDYTFRIYTRSSVVDYVTVAAEYGKSLLDLMGSWTGFEYKDFGNEKIDQVVLPDAAASLMEGWGLITYRETDLLDGDYKTSHQTKQKIICTMAREIFQQWFGGYVTPDWWSDVWLSEGLATYFQHYLPDLIPELDFDLDKQFVVNVLQNALLQDVDSSMPLSSNETEINTPAEDNGKFDDTTYYKGASIARMIKGLEGESAFQKALMTYLRKYKYNNTDVQPLLEEIMTAYYDRYTSDFSIRTWIYQSGYPILYAEYSPNVSYVTISQEQYTSSPPSNTTNTTEGNRWYIPISFATSESRDFTIEMRDLLVPGYRNRINDISNVSWIIFNVQQHGFYRVNYDDWLWDKIIAALKNDSERYDIHVLNRAQLVDDIFDFAKTGRVDYERAFDLAEYLESEVEYYPWVSALRAYTFLTDKLMDNDAQALVQRTFTRWWVSSLSKRQNSSSDSINYMEDVFFLDWSCKLGQEECINYTLTSYATFKLRGGFLPDYDKRATVFCYALRNSSDPLEEYNFLLDLYKTSMYPDERSDIISSLGCTLNTTVLQLYLNETMKNDSAIRREDVIAAYKSVYMNGEIGCDVLLDFFFASPQALVDKYSGMRVLATTLYNMTPKLHKQEQMSMINKIFDYYSEIDDLLIVGRTLVDIMDATKNFSATYADTIKSVLVEPVTDGVDFLRPSYVLVTILSLYITYLYH